jgi:hypothetical protein
LLQKKQPDNCGMDHTSIYFDEHGNKSVDHSVVDYSDDPTEGKVRRIILRHIGELWDQESLPDEYKRDWGKEFIRELEKPWSTGVGQERGIRLERLQKIAKRFAMYQVLPIANLIIVEENQPLLYNWQRKLRELDQQGALKQPLSPPDRALLKTDVSHTARLFHPETGVGIAGGEKFFNDGLFFKFSKVSIQEFIF